MAEGKGNSIWVVAGALVIGSIIGAAVASRYDDARRAVERRIEAVESQIAEQVEDGSAARREAAELQERIDELAAAVEETSAQAQEAGATAAAEGVQTLQEQVEQLAERIDATAASAQETAGEAASAVEERVNVMAQQLAAIVGRLVELEDSAGETAGAEEQEAGETAEGDEAADGDPATDGGAAAGGDEGGDAGADGEAGSEGPTTISIGATAVIGGSRVFLSGVNPETNQARVLLVGDDAYVVGGDAGPVTLANDCQLMLEGIEGRTATFSDNCPTE